jgi:hypothetical protein
VAGCVSRRRRKRWVSTLFHDRTGPSAVLIAKGEISQRLLVVRSLSETSPPAACVVARARACRTCKHALVSDRRCQYCREATRGVTGVSDAFSDSSQLRRRPTADAFGRGFSLCGLAEPCAGSSTRTWIGRLNNKTDGYTLSRLRPLLPRARFGAVLTDRKLCMSYLCHCNNLKYGARAALTQVSRAAKFRK